MKASNRNYEIIEWGHDPKDGMVLVGFSCNAVLEGKDLKQDIIDFLKDREVGYRKAVICLKDKGFASFDESKRIVEEIKEDLGETRNQQKVYRKKYNYQINRVFWTYEKNIPKKDPRYFKLNVIDLKNIDMCNYANEDKSFDSEKFIRENLSEQDIERLEKNTKKGILFQESVPKDNTASKVDGEWHVNRK